MGKPLQHPLCISPFPLPDLLARLLRAGGFVSVTGEIDPPIKPGLSEAG
jgi:hypothetical protein